MPLAYLNTRYPALSHTFIEREIRALRALNFQIHTFSIRRPTPEGQLSNHDRTAAQETYYLLDGPLSLLLALLTALLHPLAFARTLLAAQRLAPPGIKSRLHHLAYTLEAIRLAKEMLRRNLNHVHVHMANNGAAVALLATKFAPALRYSLSIHGSAEFFRIDSWTLKPKAENAAFVRCISNFCRAQVQTWTAPAAWPNYHIVHCGVDLDAFTPKPSQPSASPNAPLEIITIGRLEPIKGYPVLLEACKKLSDRGIPWHLNMVGNGPLANHLKDLAKKLQIESTVSFPGAVGQDEIQSHINRADVMVISSFMEGVPVVLMEAMAKQLAVVATKVGGIPELIDDGHDGLLVNTGCPDSLAAALQKLHASPDLRRTMGAAARLKISSQFNLAHTAAGMAELFAQYQPASHAHPAAEPRHIGQPAAPEVLTQP
ncbi:MAG: glycosyltransferase family 4 protein [Phycisphaerae bacterium]